MDSSPNCTDPTKLKAFLEAIGCQTHDDRITFTPMSAADAVERWNKTGLNELVFPPGHGDLLDDPMTGEIIFPLSVYPGMNMPAWSSTEFAEQEMRALASGKKANAFTLVEALAVFACGFFTPEDCRINHGQGIFAGGTYYGCRPALADGRTSSRPDVHLYLELFTSLEEDDAFALNIGEIRSLTRQPGSRAAALNYTAVKFIREIPAAESISVLSKPKTPWRKTKKGVRTVSATA